MDSILSAFVERKVNARSLGTDLSVALPDCVVALVMAAGRSRDLASRAIYLMEARIQLGATRVRAEARS